MKTIITKINNCSECLFIDHTGAFTKGGAKPCCGHEKTVKEMGCDCFKRVIPYKREYVLESRTICIPKEIPNWCPL